MNNVVVFAAAGNGKTYKICQEAISASIKTDRYILIVTYTNEGVRSLEKEYRKQNFGVIDKNIIITTWYSFLLSELIKPYQCLLKLKSKFYRDEHDFNVPENYINSIAFYSKEVPPRWFSAGHIQFYINDAQDIRKDNVSHLACVCMDHSDNKTISRMEGCYSHIFIDELQDYTGWDLEIILRLFKSNIAMKCVGDYKQATFRTNNSNKNKKYRDDKIRDFFIELEKKGVCSLSYDNATRRFNQEICSYVNTIHRDVESCICPYSENISHEIENTGVFIINNNDIELYCNYYNPIILRYRRDAKIKFNHNCQILNYGNSKGATFERVIIVPVVTVLPFIVIKDQKNVKAQTRSKFFVACTRARHSVVFAVDKPEENKLFKSHDIIVGDILIRVYKYHSD